MKARTSGTHVKKTITLPLALVAQMKARSANVSSFIAEACKERLLADERRAREAAMIERCRVRYGEDPEMAEDFFAAEQQVWDSEQ